MIPNGCFDYEYNGEDCRKKFGVYMITNTMDGNFYIGSTSVSFKERWRGHIKSFKDNIGGCPHLKNVARKYGIDILKFSIIELCDDYNQSISREQWWMDKLYAKYNICKIAGSTYGIKMGEVQRNNIKLQYLNGRIAWNKGKHYKANHICSEETKKRMSEAKKGKKFTEEHKSKLRGKIHTAEQNLKVKESLEKFYANGGKVHNTGKHVPIEQNNKCRESLKKYRDSPKYAIDIQNMRLAAIQRRGVKKGPHTQEHKDKLKAALKGRIPWNKGCTTSEYTKAKISASKKNPSVATRENLSKSKIGQTPWNKGKKMTDYKLSGRKKKIVDMNKLISLKEQGIPYTQISKLMGISIATIYNRLNNRQKYNEDFKEVSNG